MLKPMIVTGSIDGVPLFVSVKLNKTISVKPTLLVVSCISQLDK